MNPRHIYRWMLASTALGALLTVAQGGWTAGIALTPLFGALAFVVAYAIREGM